MKVFSSKIYDTNAFTQTVNLANCISLLNFLCIYIQISAMSSGGENKVVFEDPVDWFYLSAAMGCVTSAALAAGLTMGLLSLDTLKLKIKTMTGSEEEQNYARAILPLLENRHFLLCSLLVFNAAANEALPIFLDELVPSWLAVIFSVTLVLIFGEVVPTALFTGPSQLKIAYKLSGVVKFIQFCLYPIARPMGIALDRVLGDHHDSEEMYTRDEISAMVRILRSKGAGVQELGSPRASWHPQVMDETMAPLHVDNAVLEAIDNLGRRPTRTWHEQQAGMGVMGALSTIQSMGAAGEADDEDDTNGHAEDSPLTYGEVNVITGVLGLAKLCIADVLVPLQQVNMLSTDHVMDQDTVNAIYNVGHSRLPVCNGSDPKDIIGVFLVKRLVQLNPLDAIPLQSLEIRDLLVVGSSQSLLDVLTIFQQGQSHIAVVSNSPDELMAALAAKVRPADHFAPIGIVTIEDIFEAMIQSKIYDEGDYEDRDEKQHNEGTEALRVLQVPKNSYSFPAGPDTAADDGAATYPDRDVSVLSGLLSGAGGGSKDPNFVHPYKQHVNYRDRNASGETFTHASRRTRASDDTVGTYTSIISDHTQQTTQTASSMHINSSHNNKAIRFVTKGSKNRVEFRDERKYSTNTVSTANTGSTAATGAMRDLDCVESGRLEAMRSPPLLLHSHSNPGSALQERLLSDDTQNTPQLSKALSTGSVGSSNRLASDDSRGLQKTNKYKLTNTDGKWGYEQRVGKDKKNSEFDAKNFNRKYDAVFDAMGVPLIRDMNGNAPSDSSARPAGVAGGGGGGREPTVSRFPANAASTLKPSILAKYVKTRRYSISNSSM